MPLRQEHPVLFVSFPPMPVVYYSAKSRYLKNVTNKWMNKQMNTRWNLFFTGLIAATHFSPTCTLPSEKEWKKIPFWGIIFGGHHRRGGFCFQMPWHFWLTATQPGKRANELYVMLLWHASCIALWSQAKVLLSRRCKMQKNGPGRKEERGNLLRFAVDGHTDPWVIGFCFLKARSALAMPALLGVERELHGSVFKSQG